MIPGVKKRAFNLHDVMLYVAIGGKHLRLMILLFSLATTAGLLYFTFARPVYYSKSRIGFHYLARPMDTERLYQDGRFVAVVAGLNSGPVLERAAQVLGVKMDARELRSTYLMKQTFTPTEDGNIQLEVWPSSPEWAKRYPEVLVREFLAFRQEKRLASRQTIIDGYQKELADVQAKMDSTLNNSFDKAKTLDATKTMIELAGVRNIPGDLIRLTGLIDKIGRVRLKLQDESLDTVAKLSLISTLGGKETSLNVGQQVKIDSINPTAEEAPAAPAEPLDPADPDARREGDGQAPARNPAAPSVTRTEVVIVPSMATAPSSAWQELEHQRETVRAELEENSHRFLPGHKKMVALRKQLEGIEQGLKVELDVAQNRIALEFQELLNHRAELEERLPEYEALNRKASRVSRDSRLYDATQLPWTNFYLDMKRRLEALDYAGERERVDLTFNGILDIQQHPVSPNRTRVLLMSVMLGLLLAVVGPFLIEYLDHTLTNLEQVESTFRLRALGVVPKLAENSSRSLNDSTDGTHLVENFRVIRTNLISMGAFTKPPHVLMVTSAMPKEGKTVVSSNLAMSFAQTGSRTLLIDTDLRRGRLHRLFGYRKSPGLSNVLLGESTLEEALRPTTHANLTVLSAGRHIESGTELLGSKLFTDVMTALRSQYDRIIIDTPPVLGLSETSIMQPHVDGAVFVIWSGRTPIRNMKAAIEMLQVNGANFYGFVLNRLDLNATTNYYQYYYYSHDYYYHTSMALENA